MNVRYVGGLDVQVGDDGSLIIGGVRGERGVTSLRLGGRRRRLDEERSNMSLVHEGGCYRCSSIRSAAVTRTWARVASAFFFTVSVAVTMASSLRLNSVASAATLVSSSEAIGATQMKCAA
jgi:hypothetical protein